MEKNAVKAALILNGGGIPESIDAPYIVCADGGYNALRERGIVPNVLTGDMDSIEPSALDEARNRGVRIIKFDADKNETDGELALRFLAAEGITELDIYGAFGGRPDHEAANLALLIAARDLGVNAVIRGENCDVYYIRRTTQCSMQDNSQYKSNDKHSSLNNISQFSILNSQLLNNRPSAITISIVPRTTMKFKDSFGLKYDLSNLTIKPGSSRGVSNVAVSEDFGFTLLSGAGYVFVSCSPRPAL